MKRLRKFTDRQFKNLIDHLKEYGESTEPELLHKIRVDVKKIKSVFTLIGENKKKFKPHKKFVPLRDIFRRAGEIREPEVISKLLVQHHIKRDNDVGSPPPSDLMSGFVSDIPNFIRVAKKQRRKADAFYRYVDKNDFNKYLRVRKKEVKSKLYPHLKLQTIHKTRKVIKEVIYLSDVRDELKKSEAKFFDQTQDTIGKLHDKQVLVTLMKDKNGEADSTRIAEIKSKCVSDVRAIQHLAGAFY